MSTATPTRNTWIKPAAIAAVVLALAGVGYASLDSGGTPAPEVTYIALDGQKITSQSLRGKVVMVNFWATSCTTCVKEMPQMVDTYNKFKDQGLEFVAVAMNYDPPNYVLNFTETRKLPFKVALDTTGELAKAFGDVAMTPTTFVIDKRGKIIKRYLGEPEFGALHALLKKELAG
ncbi:MAG: TlpA disulfide reductase family protein [Telluria sp.]|jgi:peroxiredoxin|nr:TlpA disulfide reductase family protein [Telluria sp.]